MLHCLVWISAPARNWSVHINIRISPSVLHSVLNLLKVFHSFLDKFIPGTSFLGSTTKCEFFIYSRLLSHIVFHLLKFFKSNLRKFFLLGNKSVILVNDYMYFGCNSITDNSFQHLVYSILKSDIGRQSSAFLASLPGFLIAIIFHFSNSLGNLAVFLLIVYYLLVFLRFQLFFGMDWTLGVQTPVVFWSLPFRLINY